MIDLSSWALRNSKLVTFLVIVLVVGGLYGIYNMSKLEDPELKVKSAVVTTVYPGASAHEVELEVTDILEKSIRTMKNLDKVESRSLDNASVITVTISDAVSENQIEEMFTILRRKVSDAQTSLPEGSSPSIVMDDFGDVSGMFYALTNDGYTEREFINYAELIKREIMDIKGISKVSLYGQREECIYIELHEDKMANLGVFPADVISTLEGQNQTIYSGYYESNNHRLRVTVNDRYRNVEDIGNLLLQGMQGEQFRLRDIARIYSDYEKPVSEEMYYDGQRALGIAVSALSGTDITKLGKQVDKRMQQIFDTRIPVGLKLHKVFFQPDRVNSALKSFIWNLIESVLIVVLILMLTMGWRSGLIIGINLIVIVLGSLLILYMTDGTMQRVSLGAFILAMGMLVDDAIVIVDGILVDLQRGLPSQKALTNIGRQTAMPLLGATFISILAFLPIFLSPDSTGLYVRDLFVVLAVSLFLSWILALLYAPLQAKQMLKAKKNKEGKDPYDNRAYKVLRSILSWTLAHRTATIGITALLLVASLFSYRFLPQGFFPDMEYDQLYIEYKLPEGNSSKQVREDLHSITGYLLSRDEITHVTASVGGTPTRYNLIRSMSDGGLSYGELIVDYTSSDELLATMDEIQSYLTEQYPDAYVRLKRYNLMWENYPIAVQFKGADPAVLRELTEHALHIMNESPALMLTRSDWENKVPVLVADYNQRMARNAGLSRQDVGLSLLVATDGMPVSSFYKGTDVQTIYLKTVDHDGKPVESIENASVFSMMPSLSSLDSDMLSGLMTGRFSEEDVLNELMSTTPISQVTDGIRLVWNDPVIIREDGQRAMRAQANPVNGISTEDARQTIVEQVEAIELPEGYTMKWKGEADASEDASNSLFSNFPIAVILMISILILLFKDYKKPLIIFFCLPLLLVGVVFGMLISGKVFGFTAMVGVLGLMGLIIRNGVVLMDEINLQLSKGVEPVKALLDSSSSRFRPVMMASLTTILGMIPLLSDDLFGPLAATMMGGLLVGTLITLLIVPTLYSLFFHIKIKKQ
ncbi:MAG: efflux RND transporter permease subunit [Bacteroidales bacterium]|nr:efflux RND transporter permease subunit [Acholeplasmataceae bacterium]MCK9449238.1 efflux RND transporter permease subunit [Bacteroidales bacterium]